MQRALVSRHLPAVAAAAEAFAVDIPLLLEEEEEQKKEEEEWL